MPETNEVLDAPEKHEIEIAAHVGEDSEEVKKLVNVPECLAHMSNEELQQFELKLRRKIDLRLMPTLVIIYILNYLDRNNIATARLGGLETTLNLTSVKYQTAVSILFVGYILMQTPSNMIMDRITRPSVYLTTCMLCWGVVSTCTGAVQSFGGLIAVRFLLGFIEAVYFPGCLYFLSTWYTKSELSLRTAMLYSGSLISGAFAGLLGAAIIDHLDGARGLAAWRWLFIIEGSITIFLVPFAYFILPDKPATTSWLTEEEKELASWRLRREVGIDDWANRLLTSPKFGFLLAVKDPKVWLFCGIITFNVAAAGVTNFFPTVVQTLHYDTNKTLLLTAPPYLLAVISTYINAWHSDKTGERFLHATIPLGVAISAFIIACSTLNTGARYFSMMIMVPSIYCSYTVVLSWTSQVIPRPSIKRAIALALLNTISNSCSIWTAYLYPASDAPRYLVAFICNAVFLLCSFLLICTLRIVLGRLNKKLEDGTLNIEKEFGPGASTSATLQTFRYIH